MASILRVNTITDASSNNSTAVSTINKGSAKAWVSLNMESSNAIDDSYNHSSLTDNGTGDLTHAWTNACEGATYAFHLTCTQIQSGGVGYVYGYAGNTNARTYRTASNHRVTHGYSANTDLHDLAMHSYTWHGDLA